METCPACGSPLVNDPQRGEVACARCGLVVAVSAVDTGPEWRVFDEEERERVRAAPLKLVIKTDMDVRPEHGERWRRLAKMNQKALHGREWRLVEVGAELKRIKGCAGLPQHVVKAAEELARRHLEALRGFPPEAVAAAALWVAAKALGEPRPLEDVLVCCKTEEKVRRAAWRLMEAARPGRMSIEDYVKVLAARAGVPAPVVKRAVEILEKKRRLLAGKNPWVWAAAALWLASLESSVVFFASMLADAAGVSLQSLVTAAERLRT